MVVLWDLSQPDLGKLIANIPGSVYAMAFNEDFTYLAVGHNHDGIHLIDWVTKKEVRSLSFTSVQVFSLCWVGETIYAGTADGMLIAIKMPELMVEKKWQLGSKSIRRIKFLENEKKIAIASSDTCIRIWDTTSQQQTKIWEAHTNSVFSLAFSPDGQYLASVGRDANLRLWKTGSSYEAVKSVPAHNYSIHDVIFHPTGPYLATVSMDKAVKIWHWPSLKLLKVIDKARHAGHGTSVNAVYWSLYKNQLITAGDDRKISVWQLDEDLLHQRAIQ